MNTIIGNYIKLDKNIYENGLNRPQYFIKVQQNFDLIWLSLS